MDKALLKQALDALLNAVPCTAEQIEEQRSAIAALQAAIALPVQPSLAQIVRQIVDEQAEDDALWCKAHTIIESMLQIALRRLHAAIENIALPVQPADDKAFAKQCRDEIAKRKPATQPQGGDV